MRAGLMLKRLDGSAAYEPSRRSEAWIKVGAGAAGGSGGRGARTTRQHSRTCSCMACAIGPALATYNGNLST